MDRFVEIFKRHPLWILGGVVAVILLIWYMSSGSGSSQPVIVSTGPSDATVNANAAIESERIKSAAAGAANSAAIQMAQINADAYTQFLSTSKDVSENTNLTQEHLASIVTGATTSQTQVQATAMTDLANIDKAKAESLANISASLQREQIQGANTVAAAQAASAVTLAQIQANNDQATLDKKLGAALNWSNWAIPGNYAALWGIQPADNINVQIGNTLSAYNNGGN